MKQFLHQKRIPKVNSEHDAQRNHQLQAMNRHPCLHMKNNEVGLQNYKIPFQITHQTVVIKAKNVESFVEDKWGIKITSDKEVYIKP